MPEYFVRKKKYKQIMTWFCTIYKTYFLHFCCMNHMIICDEGTINHIIISSIHEHELFFTGEAFVQQAVGTGSTGN